MYFLLCYCYMLACGQNNNIEYTVIMTNIITVVYYTKRDHKFITSVLSAMKIIAKDLIISIVATTRKQLIRVLYSTSKLPMTARKAA